MKFDTANNEWTRFWSDRNRRWHIFTLISPGFIDEVLEEIERDQTNFCGAETMLNSKCSSIGTSLGLLHV
jgi:hypothetical protein